MSEKKNKNAEEEVKNQEGQKTEFNEDNFFSEDIAKLAKEKNESEKTKEKVEKLRTLQKKFQYINQKSHIQTKHAGRVEEALSGMRKATRELLEGVEKGKFTPIQAETEMSKIQDEAIAKIRKANSEKLENLRELRDNFDGWNWYSWENPLDRVMRAID
jgi:hypothetical protein